MKDAEILRLQHYVVGVSPMLSTTSLFRYSSASGLATISGVNEEYFDATGLAIVAGVGFDHEDVTRQAQVIVIDENIKHQFFEFENPLGKTVYVGNLPCIIIGVTGRNRRMERKVDNRLNAWIPHTVVS